MIYTDIMHMFWFFNTNNYLCNPYLIFKFPFFKILLIIGYRQIDYL